MKKTILLSTLLPLMAMATNYSIGDKVWYDKNQDWEQGLDEQGYPNVTVNLLNDAGKKIASTKTDANGNYQFKNKPEGEYSVTVTPPQGTTLVTESPIGLWLEENRHDINFGIFKLLTYSISGTIWNDKDEDWEMGVNEPTVANVTVELYNNNGKKVATTKTNSKGIYKFSKLQEGEYSVKVIESNTVSIVTESPLGLWVEANRNDMNFGVLTSTVSNPPITREQLITLIRNGEDVTNVNTSQITDMHSLFNNQYTFNQDISNWDVSNVTDMSNMFFNAEKFNQPIGKWNVSNVIDMNGLFFGAKSFNQPLKNWNMSKVIYTHFMFYKAYKFNQNIGNWDVSNVIKMNSMFAEAERFNQNINSWNVSNVTSMNEMFIDAYKFNQPLNSWNVSKVTKMNNMFANAENFNQNINQWDTSSVIYIRSMFYNAVKFNQVLNNWNLSNVTDMSSMFSGARNFNQALNNWDVSKVTDMGHMFYDAKNFNQDISNWDVSNVISHSYLFYQCPIKENFKPQF